MKHALLETLPGRAILFGAVVKLAMMLSLSRIHSSPRDLLVMANRMIAEHLDSRSLITMAYAVACRPGQLVR